MIYKITHPKLHLTNQFVLYFRHLIKTCLKHLFSLNKYFIKYKKLFLFGIVFTLLSNYFRILSPQVSKFIIDKVAAEINPSKPALSINHYNFIVKFFINYFNQSNLTSLVIYSGVGLLLLAILGGLFMFFMRQTIIVMSRHIEFDQKNEVFSHYQKLDIEFYKTHSTGDLMNRISDDVSKVRMYTGPAIMYIINLLGTIGFSLFFMFKDNATLSLYVIAPLPILVVIIYYVNNVINNKSEQLQTSLSELTTIAQESYSGIRVIKSFVQEKITQQFFEAKSNDYKKNATSLAKVEALYFPSIALLIGLSTLIAIAAGCVMYIKNPQAVTAGTIAEFVIYVNMLTFPVSAIGLTASMIQRAAASQKRLNEFLHIKPEITNNKSPNLQPVKSETLNVELSNLSFTYPHSGIQALKDINLQIKNSEKILILGKTGSGKSTLALLLMRLYNADKGSISANGIRIEQLNIKEWREQIGYVPQDVFLFSDTVKENIEFGNSNPSSIELIEQIAAIAAVDKEIEGFEKQYETVIGERGVTLSGGQKQRIAISRALMKDANLYVFDDCFSAVDNITEKKIGTALTSFLQHKSAIFISHRIFREFIFDKIIVLDDGSIVEQGTHNELMQLNGYYAATYTAQMNH
jgi:ATP-binding cassette subfamily B protein